ncbi:hypothetical protein Z043_121137 [Scleropages formosus]|uniref:Uncharacterized protein n=1 Tax=Scleropages formosus TaxID=113540 RepID=A0A0P7WCJ9_SCLFO|nr:hypothetical protein Z043_121137 [Scleropages formosus]
MPVGGNLRWCLSQEKGAVEDDVAEAECNHSGELLATGDKSGRVVIFQQELENKSKPQYRGKFNVYSTFRSHEPEFNHPKSLEIEEKIKECGSLPALHEQCVGS